MVMCSTNNKVWHGIIYSQLSNGFTNCSTILKIKGVRLHPLNITFFTKHLKIIKKTICEFDVLKKVKAKKGIPFMKLVASCTNSISSFGITSMSSSCPLSESSNIERLGLENLFLSSIASCSITYNQGRRSAVSKYFKMGQLYGNKIISCAMNRKYICNMWFDNNQKTIIHKKNITKLSIHSIHSIPNKLDHHDPGVIHDFNQYLSIQYNLQLKLIIQ